MLDALREESCPDDISCTLLTALSYLLNHGRIPPSSHMSRPSSSHNVLSEDHRRRFVEGQGAATLVSFFCDTRSPSEPSARVLDLIADLGSCGTSLSPTLIFGNH